MFTSETSKTSKGEKRNQDFINALNIHQGSKPGNPAYGTSLWSFIFEPNTDDIRLALEEEIKRVASTASSAERVFCRKPVRNRNKSSEPRRPPSPVGVSLENNDLAPGVLRNPKRKSDASFPASV